MRLTGGHGQGLGPAGFACAVLPMLEIAIGNHARGKINLMVGAIDIIFCAVIFFREVSKCRGLELEDAERCAMISGRVFFPLRFAYNQPPESFRVHAMLGRDMRGIILHVRKRGFGRYQDI